MTVVVVATIRPKPEHRAEVVEAFERAVARVHTEDAGCELYALHEAPDRLVMIEKWSDAQALREHGHGAALVALGADLDGKLAEPTDVVTMTPHPAGTPVLGVL